MVQGHTASKVLHAETQWTSVRINLKRFTDTYIIVMMLKAKDMWEMLKAGSEREKRNPLNLKEVL